MDSGCLSIPRPKFLAVFMLALAVTTPLSADHMSQSSITDDSDTKISADALLPPCLLFHILPLSMPGPYPCHDAIQKILSKILSIPYHENSCSSRIILLSYVPSSSRCPVARIVGPPLPPHGALASQAALSRQVSSTSPVLISSRLTLIFASRTSVHSCVAG